MFRKLEIAVIKVNAMMFSDIQLPVSIYYEVFPPVLISQRVLRGFETYITNVYVFTGFVLFVPTLRLSQRRWSIPCQLRLLLKLFS